MTRLIISGVGLCVLFGCSEPVGPVDLGEMYSLVSAAGNTLPWRAYQVYEQSGCTADLLGLTITFSEFGQFEAALSTQMTCGDGQRPRSSTLSRGTYTRSGDAIHLTPNAATTFSLYSVTVRSSGLNAVLSTSGDQYDLVFKKSL